MGMGYVGDTDGFWERRGLAKTTLRERQNRPENRERVQKALAADVESLKNAKIVKEYYGANESDRVQKIYVKDHP